MKFECKKCRTLFQEAESDVSDDRGFDEIIETLQLEGLTDVNKRGEDIFLDQEEAKAFLTEIECPHCGQTGGLSVVER